MASAVIQLSIKPRVPGEPGLPKRPVARLVVTPTGCEGDYNHYRTRSLANDPDQAVLLVTDEAIASLVAEGWPMTPGDFGENITLGGVAEASLVPGTLLTIGAVRLEVSKPCEPCSNLYHLPYVGRERGPEFLRVTRDRRGWYARVLTPGTIGLSDRVTVETPAARA